MTSGSLYYELKSTKAAFANFTLTWRGKVLHFDMFSSLWFVVAFIVFKFCLVLATMRDGYKQYFEVTLDIYSSKVMPINFVQYIYKTIWTNVISNIFYKTFRFGSTEILKHCLNPLL